MLLRGRGGMVLGEKMFCGLEKDKLKAFLLRSMQDVFCGPIKSKSKSTSKSKPKL